MAAKLSEDQIKEIKEAFFLFDVKNQGKIPTSELGNAVRSIGHNPSQADIDAMVKHADKKGTGTVAEKEFIETVSKFWKPLNTEQDIVDAFKQFDHDGSGYLDGKQLKHVLLNLGEQMTEAEVDELLKEASLDSDGQLNYTSLAQMLLASAK